MFSFCYIYFQSRVSGFSALNFNSSSFCDWKWLFPTCTLFFLFSSSHSFYLLFLIQCEKAKNNLDMVTKEENVDVTAH